MDEVDRNAKIIWDYMHMNHQLSKADAIIVLGGMDTSPALRAAELYKEGLAEKVLFTGGFGSQTKDLFEKPEAETFAEIAMKHGVPKDSIIIEPKATNTGENIRFSYELLKKLDVPAHKIILVQKPYFERRAYATFRKQWPDAEAEIIATSPTISYEEYFRNLPKEKIINIMVGDLQRIREYPKLGYQVEQGMPDEVWSAYENLVQLGYDKHLI